MLVLDELPLSSLLTSEGEINATLFPSFARLADSAHWFQNAQSNSTDTAQSVPSILTGTLKEDVSPTSRDHPRNLFTMLGESYALAVAETLTALCPSEVCEAEGVAADVSSADSIGLWDLLVDASVVWGHRTQPPFVRAQLPSIDNRWGGFVGESDAPAAASPGAGLPAPAAERASWMVKMLAMADNVESDWPSGTLHYTHALAPHAPWVANPSGSMYESPETQQSEVAGVENRRWLEDEAWAVQGLQRHLLQLGSVDLLLGRIIQSLERSGLWDHSLIIVTADHGASFAPGDYWRWVSSTNVNAVYRVPLFIRTPGQREGRVHTESAYSVDILPTIVDVLDVELGPEWTFAGRSLLQSSLPSLRPHHTLYGTTPGRSIDGVFDEIDAIDALVPDRSSWQRVAAVGPNRALIGAATTSLRPRSDVRVVADIDQGASYRDLDSGGGTVPTVLTGRITLPEPLSGRHVLVAVNGRVSGAGFAVAEHGDTSMFQALVPEEAYHPGWNDVSILVADESQTWIQARPDDVDQAMLRDAAGDDLHLVSGRERRVALEATTIDGQDLSVGGWAANTKTKEPVAEILLYFGDELVRHGPPNEQRPDLVRRFGSDRLLHAGFNFSIPTSKIPEGTERLTVAGRFSDGDVVVYVTIPTD
jgi:Sulfatase